MEANAGNASEAAGDTVQKNWVKFDEEKKEEVSKDVTPTPVSIPTDEPPVLEAESMEVIPQKSRSVTPSSNSYTSKPEGSEVRVNMAQVVSAQDLHTVNLNDGDVPISSDQNGLKTSESRQSIRTGFGNGDIIVTLLPINTRFPWVTPAEFRPELVPEELMAQGLTLTVEEYVQVIEKLVQDKRFTTYNICYKRILMAWIIFGFVILLALLFSGIKGLTLFGCGVIWLIINASAIFFCMWLKVKLSRNLERCMASVNENLLKHKIILGLDDRGRLSCHKINLCFIYFDTGPCIEKLKEIIQIEEAAGRTVNSDESRKRARHLQQQMDIPDNSITIVGANTTTIPRKQGRAERLLLRYIQRWAKDFLRNRLDWTVEPQERLNSHPSSHSPRHLRTAYCLCQYIQEHLAYKPIQKQQNSFPCCDSCRE